MLWRFTTLVALSAALMSCIGETATDNSDVDVVITNGPGPTILSFTATPKQIETGQLVRLEWEVESAEEVLIYDGDGNNIYQSTQNIGSHSVSPQKTDTYTLLVKNVRGENRATLSVQVEVYYPAEIIAFGCAPLTANHGDEMEIQWQVIRATDGIEVYANDQLLFISNAKRGFRQLVPRSTTEFRLVAKSPDGDDERTSTCVVADSPPAIREFYANPIPAQLYGTAELRWEAYGATEIVLERMFPEPRSFPVSEMKDGTLTVSVNHTSAQYQLTVKNPKGETSRLLVLTTGDTNQEEDRIEESEPNNEFGLADDSTLNAVGTRTLWGRMYPRGDPDFWRFEVPVGANLNFDTWVYGTQGVLSSCNGDTVLELYNEEGMKINEDNNGATSVCPAFRNLDLAAGVYYMKLRLRFPGNFDHEYYMDVSLR